MRIILAPAMTMAEKSGDYKLSEPVFIKDAKALVQRLQKMSDAELTKMWGCSAELAQENIVRLAKMNLDEAYTPSIVSYTGLAYQYLDYQSLDDLSRSFLHEHLRILSGLYGVLRPMDKVTPYRLEMRSLDLYRYWGERLYKEVADDSKIILNLASEEYAKCICKYTGADVRYVTCVFGKEKNGKVSQGSSYAKMARGAMVRYIAQNLVNDIEELKDFTEFGFVYAPEYSDENTLVWLR